MALDPNRSSPPRHSRLPPAVIGTGIGLVIGVFWSLVFGPLTDGPPSLDLSFLVYTTGFAFTGFLVGVIGRVPPLVGIIVGTITLSAWALFVGPDDPWMVLWVMIFGGSGLLWGCIIGVLFWFTARRHGLAGESASWLRRPSGGNGVRVTEVVTGVVLVVGCPILFGVCASLVVIGLNRFVPGYYPGVFPERFTRMDPAAKGMSEGSSQGVALGLLAGIAVATALGWFHQLRPSSGLRALGVLSICAVVFGVGGALVGYGMGVFNPGYYRGMIFGGRMPDFNPVDVGVGLGCSEGLILGVFVGVLTVVLLAWRQRLETGAERIRAA